MDDVVSCPACKEQLFEPLVDFGRVPRSGTFLEQAADVPPTEGLRFEFCRRCGLIRRAAVAAETVDYTAVPRLTARQQPDYLDGVVSRLRAAAGSDRLVVDVGANDGDLLDRLAGAGVRRLLGIEPSRAAVAVLREKGHHVEPVHLDPEEAERLRAQHGPAAAVACRHTLEHVPDPRAFLTALRVLLADDGICFLEVPDGSPIVARLRGHELWDEHLHMFTEANLPAPVRRAGFAVDAVERRPHRSSYNVLLWAHAHPAGNTNGEIPPPVDVTDHRRFEARWRAVSDAFAIAVAQAPDPVVAVGASHLQTNFLLFSRAGAHVSRSVDDDPSKLGRFVPVPQPVPVVASVEIMDRRIAPGTILRTAFGYDGWMDALCSASDAAILDPLAYLDAELERTP